AVVLNKLSAEFVQLVSRCLNFRFWWNIRNPKSKIRNLTLGRRAGLVTSAGLLLALLAYLGAQNFHDYYEVYAASYPFTEVTGQAYFVRQMNAEVMAEKRPTPRYYDLGSHFIYWG